MNNDEATEAAVNLYQAGYKAAPEFLKAEGTTPEFFIRALIWDYSQGKPKTPDMFFKDAGAMAWCIDQISKGSIEA